MVRLTRREPDYVLDDFTTFEEVVRSIFTHRRKKIRNCLKLNFKDIELDDLEHMDERAEVLEPREIAELSNKIFARKSK